MLIRPYGIPNKGAYYTMLCSEVAIGKEDGYLCIFVKKLYENSLS